MGKKKCPSTVIHHFLRRLSRFCARAEAFLSSLSCLSSMDCFREFFAPSARHLPSDFVPEHLRASGVGWYSTTVGLLGLVASIVAGLLWDRIGHAAVFYYGAAFALVGSIGLLVLIPGRQNKPTEAAGR